MTKLTVLSYLPTNENPLGPAPNVNETAYIANILSQDTTPIVTDLMAGPLTVLTNHRGVLLYCAGGVTVHRTNPSGLGVNSYSSIPPTGTEEVVSISCKSGRFTGAVRFDEP